MTIPSHKEFEYHLFIVALDIFLESTLDDESKIRLISTERARLSERLEKIKESPADLFTEEKQEVTI